MKEEQPEKSFLFVITAVALHVCLYHQNAPEEKVWWGRPYNGFLFKDIWRKCQ